jgi:hypothetical protein
VFAEPDDADDFFFAFGFGGDFVVFSVIDGAHRYDRCPRFRTT